MNALRYMGNVVEGLDTTSLNTPPHPWTRARKRLRSRPTERAIAAFNRQVLAHAELLKPDLVIGFRTLWITRSTLEALPHAAKIHWHPDDTANPHNVTDTYMAAENVWDLQVTTKSFNVAEMQARGVTNAMFVYSCYDRRWHRPLNIEWPKSYRLAFIGTRHPDRRALVRDLARAYGKLFLLCGSRWGRSPVLRHLATVRGPQYGLAMSRAVGSAEINLGLLNSANRDLHTCRSLEVPAAGGLLLAERTSEHSQLFRENEEAVFFDSVDDLYVKIDSLILKPNDAQAMARSGHLRVVSDGHTYEDRAAAILRRLGF